MIRCTKSPPSLPPCSARSPALPSVCPGWDLSFPIAGPALSPALPRARPARHPHAARCLRPAPDRPAACGSRAATCGRTITLTIQRLIVRLGSETPSPSAVLVHHQRAHHQHALARPVGRQLLAARLARRWQRRLPARHRCSTSRRGRRVRRQTSARSSNDHVAYPDAPLRARRTQSKHVVQARPHRAALRAHVNSVATPCRRAEASVEDPQPQRVSPTWHAARVRGSASVCPHLGW